MNTNDERLVHDWVVRTLRARLSRDYKDIYDNTGGKDHEMNGYYPDIIFGNHGLVLGAMEVETETTISSEKAKEWKSLATSGNKLVLMVPKRSVKHVTDLLWEAGVADRVSIGTYDVVIQMP